METDEFVKRDRANVWQAFLSAAIASAVAGCMFRTGQVRRSWCGVSCAARVILPLLLFIIGLFTAGSCQKSTIKRSRHPLCTYAGHGVVCGVYINFTGVILAASYRVHAFIISLGSHLLGKVYQKICCGGCFVRLYIQYQSFDLFEITRARYRGCLCRHYPFPPHFSLDRENSGKRGEKYQEGSSSGLSIPSCGRVFSNY